MIPFRLSSTAGELNRKFIPSLIRIVHEVTMPNCPGRISISVRHIRQLPSGARPG